MFRNHAASVKYCQKMESRAPGTEPIIYGQDSAGFGRQGFRSDLSAVTDMIKSGASLKAIAEELPEVYMKYHSGIEKAQGLLVEPGAFVHRKVYMLHDPTGTGKTRYVYDTHGYKEVYKWNNTGKWFDGYHGQAAMLCDDVRWEMDTAGAKSYLNGRTIGWWLNFLDGYPVKVEVKGSTRWMTSKHIYLTSNQDPLTWWSNYSPGEAFDPFMRRIKHVYSVQ